MGSNVKFASWHVGVAAEAITAALFARCGCDISVQYGANQPEYDLVAVQSDRILKISVKGSQDGGWGLTQSHLKNADYHGAVALWLKRHQPRTIFALVQFKDVEIMGMPRVYLATPVEIGKRLRETAKGRGDTVLYERHEWTPRAVGAGTVEEIPPKWRFSEARVEQLFETA